MIHAPDMMGTGLDAADCGSLEVYNSRLETRSDLVSTFDYSSYNDAVEAYVDYVSGDLILVKSTSTDINLDRAILKSYNGVIFHTVLNSDSMGNFLAEGDNDLVDPAALTMTDMNAKGDIIHQDYQRNMQVTLNNTTLEGKILLNSFEDWCTLWEEKGVTDANWLPDSEWAGSNSLSVALEGKSTWVISGTSNLTSLTIDDNSKIKGKKGKEVVMTVNGEETELEPGTYSGEIELSLDGC